MVETEMMAVQCKSDIFVALCDTFVQNVALLSRYVTLLSR